MLVHFVHDDKFIDMALREFELAAPGANLAIMLSRPGPLRHVKNPDVRFLGMREAVALLHSPDCEGVVLHTLQDGYLTLLRRMPAGKKVVWLGWGADYYDRLLAGALPQGLLLPATARLERELAGSGWRGLAAAARRAASRAVARVRSRQALPRVDIFAPVIEPEHALACSLNPWFRPAYVRWNYGTLEDDLLPRKDGSPLGSDVLVGNSASATNNHLEAFEMLKTSFDLQGRRVVVPLSYGDPRYGARVIEQGRRLFGAQFVPVTDYLDQDAYIRLLDACGFVVMNHLRQQALGNIYIMMTKGARILLRQSNPLYPWLIAQGAQLDALDAPSDGAARRALEPLSEAQRARNAQVVRSAMSRDVQRARTRRLVQEVLDGGPVPAARGQPGSAAP